jgi:hypothetical protein
MSRLGSRQCLVACAASWSRWSFISGRWAVHLIYFARLDRVARGTADAAIIKARIAANYGLPTRTLQDAVA